MLLAKSNLNASLSNWLKSMTSTFWASFPVMDASSVRSVVSPIPIVKNFTPCALVSCKQWVWFRWTTKQVTTSIDANLSVGNGGFGVSVGRSICYDNCHVLHMISIAISGSEDDVRHEFYCSSCVGPFISKFLSHDIEWVCKLELVSSLRQEWVEICFSAKAEQSCTNARVWDFKALKKKWSGEIDSLLPTEPRHASRRVDRHSEVDLSAPWTRKVREQERAKVKNMLCVISVPKKLYSRNICDYMRNK